MPGSKISKDWENALENGSFTPYFMHYNQRRRHKEGDMKFNGGRLGKQEKAEWGNLSDWIKK